MNERKGRTVEVFMSGCHLCKETVDMIKDSVCDECTVIEYDLEDDCNVGCVEKARACGVMSVPTVVIDGKIAIEGRPTIDGVKKALFG